MPKSVDARIARHTDGVAGAVPSRRAELQTDRDTSAVRKQSGGHPNRMHGSHDGMTVSEHQRKGRKL